MTAFLALLVDAYRELNARKLFWVTMAVSGVVVLGFGAIGFTETGVSLFFGLWEVEGPLTAGSPMARAFYMGLFSYFIVGIWMTWAATILALVSTTSIFPDFMAGGAIDIVLAKPISRLRLFATKYFASMLFVVLQVAVFCTGIFLCVGLRIGEWNPKIFLAIPVITVFFSYLFAVNVFLGVITRSGLTALLLTMVFWSSLFGIGTAENILNTFRTQQLIDIERSSDTIDTLTKRIEGVADSDSEQGVARRTRWKAEVESEKTRREAAQELDDALGKWHTPISYVQYLMPKTSETVNLLNRSLKDPNGMDIFQLLNGDFDDDGPRQSGQDADQRVREETDARSLWYVLGTSLAFELAVLSLAAWLFCRRDF